MICTGNYWNVEQLFDNYFIPNPKNGACRASPLISWRLTEAAPLKLRPEPPSRDTDLLFSTRWQQCASIRTPPGRASAEDEAMNA